MMKDLLAPSSVPKGKFTTLTTLSFRLAKDAVVTMEDDDYRKAGAGAKVTRCVAWRLSTTDTVVEQILERVEVP